MSRFTVNSQQKYKNRQKPTISDNVLKNLMNVLNYFVIIIRNKLCTYIQFLLELNLTNFDTFLIGVREAS